MYVSQRGLKMERSLSPPKFEIGSHRPSETHESSRCNTCGEEFEEPLFTVVSSGYLLEEYYACPRCLSKVGDVERNKTVEVDEAEEENENVQEMEVEDKMEETVACAHHLGYLKRRPKKTPIPEECLTCAKMIDCISY
jgi:DNA-directed RNA polymerase subunit RPC12/RpoP